MYIRGMGGSTLVMTNRCAISAKIYLLLLLIGKSYWSVGSY